MRIRRPRNLSTVDIIVVTVVGIFGGAYIWRPIFEKQSAERSPSPSSTPTIDASVTGSVLT